MDSLGLAWASLGETGTGTSGDDRLDAGPPAADRAPDAGAVGEADPPTATPDPPPRPLDPTPVPRPPAPPATVAAPQSVLPAAAAPSFGPALDLILATSDAYFPEQAAKARRVFICEMGADPGRGTHSDRVWRLDLAHLGPGQIGRSSWERFFLTTYGWTWEQLGRDLDIHFRAVRIIYDRAGGWGPWPVCGLR